MEKLPQGSTRDELGTMAKEKQGTRTDIPQISAKSYIDTKKEVAKIANVSHDTVKARERQLSGLVQNDSPVKENFPEREARANDDIVFSFS